MSSYIVTEEQHHYYIHGQAHTHPTLADKVANWLEPIPPNPDDFEDGNTIGWSEHWMTEALYPIFDVATYTGPSPYPSGTKRGRLYMQDSTGDKAVIYKWDSQGDQLLRTALSSNHKY